VCVCVCVCELMPSDDDYTTTKKSSQRGTTDVWDILNSWGNANDITIDNTTEGIRGFLIEIADKLMFEARCFTVHNLFTISFVASRFSEENYEKVSILLSKLNTPGKFGCYGILSNRSVVFSVSQIITPCFNSEIIDIMLAYSGLTISNDLPEFAAICKQNQDQPLVARQ
jgi:hypothetical protein